MAVLLSHLPFKPFSEMRPIDVGWNEWPKLDKDEQRAANQRKWAKHRDKLLAYHKRKWQALISTPEGRERVRAYWRKSYATLAGRERAKQREHIRRARKRNTITERFPHGWRARMYEDQEGLCFYCKNPIPNEKMHIEHKIPLAKGGPHVLENIALACPSCNLKKKDKTAEEFLASTA